MDMSDIGKHVPLGEIIVKYIDKEKINNRLSERIQALSYQLNDKASAQLQEDAGKVEADIQGEGKQILAKIALKQSYLIQYLKNHDVPVAGGDNGTAHNVDGSTYQSSVDPKFWGNELESLMLPIMDVIEEEENLLNITFKEDVEEAQSAASEEICEALKPDVAAAVAEHIQHTVGGGS